MIRNLRNALTKNKYIQYGLWSTLALGFVAGSFIYRGAQQHADKDLVTVDGHVITLKEYHITAAQYQERLAVMLQQFEQFGPQFVQMIMSQLGNPQVQAMDYLVTKYLLQGLAHKMGLRSWDDAFVSSQFRNRSFGQRLYGTIIPVFAFRPDGSIDKKKVAQYLERTGTTFEELDTKIAEMLTMVVTQNLIQLAGYQPRAERLYHALTKQGTRSVTAFTLPFGAYEQEVAGQPISDDELRAYWQEKNKQKVYWSPEQRTGTTYTFTPASFGITLSDDEVAQTYEQRKQQFRKGGTDEEPVYRTLEEVAADLKKSLQDEKFAQRFEQEAQRVLRQRKSSPHVFTTFIKERNGVQQELEATKETQGGELEAALFELERPGMARVAARRTQKGVEGVIILLDTITPSVERRFEEIADTVRHDLMQERAQRARDAALAAFSQRVESLPRGATAEEWAALAGDAITFKTYTITADQAPAAQSATHDGIAEERMRALIHPGSFFIEHVGEDRVVVVLTGIDGLNPAQAEEEARHYPQGSLQDATYLSQSLVAYLQKHATIKVHQTA